MKNFIRTISFMIVTVLVLSAVLPVAVYAYPSTISTNDGTKTGPEDITIQVADDEPLRKATSEIMTIPVIIDAYNSSYIKDASINFENNNFSVAAAELAKDKNVQSVNDSVIKLNSSEIDETIELNVPVSFKEAEYVSEDYFNKAATIKIAGTYVDKNGEEKTFNKTTQVNVSWYADQKVFVANTEIVRSFMFNENGQNSLMVTIKLTAGIENGTVPEKEKVLEVNVPKIRETYPQVLVSADGFTSEENQAQEKITLTKNIEKNSNNEYKWNKENDVVYLTYVYRNANSNFYSDKKEVKFTSSVITIDNTEQTIHKDSNGAMIPLDANQELKNVIIATVTSTPSINRGAIISNAGVETNIDVKYSLNVGYPAITNAITLKEDENPVLGSSEKTVSKTKIVSVNASELTSVLGDDGKITISLTEGTDTYEINKNNTTITIPDGKKINTITTSKPSGAGNLTINMVKTVTSDDQITSSNVVIVGKATITNVGSDNNQTTSTCRWETRIEDPTQKIQFESKFKTLSTIKKNERMILSVVLESDSVDDYLFKNPALRITYPKDIKTISNVTVNVLYDDYNEFSKNINPTIDNENHTIVVELSGTQTHYISSAVSKGILIQIVADYTLDRLTPTKDETIQLEVYNAITGPGAITTLQKEVKIIAPSEFIIQNKMDVISPTNANGTSDKNYFKESRTTIEENVEDIILPLYSNAKHIDVYGTVVNNQGTDVNNVAIIGNFPSKNSNSYSGAQFNGTFDTTVIGGIRVDKENQITDETPNGTYEVYYSKNANEPLNSNNWTRDILSDAKSYKIVFTGTFKNAERKDFHYQVKTPTDMGYNEKGKESFALLYENGSVAGEQYSYLEAKPIGLATKPEADFNVNISVKDYVTNQEINNGDTVDEGEYMNLKISITNTSNRNIRNVKAVIDLKQNLGVLDFSNGRITHSEMDQKIEESINEIKASETKVINKTIYVKAVSAVKQIEGDSPETATFASVDEIEGQDVYSIMNVQIYEGNELEFKPQEFKNKINSKKVAGITISPAESTDIGISDTFQQFFYIRNLTVNDMENIEIKGKLPKGIEYDSEANEAINTQGLTYSYDSNSREYIIKIDKVEGKSITSRITINFKTTEYGTYELKSRVNAENEEINLNNVNVTVVGKARNFSTTHKISTSTNEVKDTDTFYFNITITNHWDSDKLVIYKDRLNDNFVVYECTVLQNNIVKTKQKNINLIEYTFEMQPEDVGEIRIKCGLKTQAEGSTINLTHSPEANCNDVNISITPITISVIGTGEFVNTKNPVIEGKYNISGTAWLDANNNGRREETEQKISNIRMKLIDNKTNKVFVDDSGNEKITVTNSNGEYVFTNIPVGSYVVVAYYDSEKFGCGDYQNRSVAEDLNNDFIETTYEGAIVGATNNIIVENTSVSAIDISLIPRNTFDMALEKNVTNVAVSTSNGKEANYTFNSELAKVEISNEKDVKYYFTIEYTLTVKNIGYIDGYAKTVIDYIPKGMTFVQEDNPGWYIKSDGYAYNNTLANKLIKAQDKAEVKIKLRKEMTAEQTGIIKNSAELGDTYNTEGLEDINSKGANKDSSENDYSEALVVVALSTGGEIIKVAGIVFGVLGLGVLILSATKYKRKKKII